MSPELVGRVVERLRALADERRIRLLMELREGEANVTTLAERLELGQASVSKHLGVLRRAGLVRVRREGPQAIYSVSDASIYELCRHVCEGVLRHVEAERKALGLSGGAEAGRRRS